MPAAGDARCAHLNGAERSLKRLGKTNPGATNLDGVPRVVAKPQDWIQSKANLQPLLQAVVELSAVLDIAARALMKHEHEFASEHAYKADRLADQNAIGAEFALNHDS